MAHQDFDAYRSSTLHRKTGKKRLLQLSLTRDDATPPDNFYGERRKGSSAIARVVFIIILLHILVVGGTCLRKKLSDDREPVAASTQAPPPSATPAPTASPSPAPSSSISTSGTPTASSTPTLPSMLGPAPTLPSATDSSSQGDIHITSAPTAASEDIVAVEVPEDKPAPVASTYTIQSGDLWGRIANKHGLSTQELQAANPQVSDPNKIAVGMVLNIPAKGSKAKATATPAATAKAVPAPAATPAPAAKPQATASPSAKTYTVQSGDTMYRIASKTKVPFATLLKLNNIKKEDAGNIRPGQQLKLVP